MKICYFVKSLVSTSHSDCYAQVHLLNTVTVTAGLEAASILFAAFSNFSLFPPWAFQLSQKAPCSADLENNKHKISMLSPELRMTKPIQQSR